jgi:hypothetical protein
VEDIPHLQALLVLAATAAVAAEQLLLARAVTPAVLQVVIMEPHIQLLPRLPVVLDPEVWEVDTLMLMTAVAAEMAITGVVAVVALIAA